MDVWQEMIERVRNDELTATFLKRYSKECAAIDPVIGEVADRDATWCAIGIMSGRKRGLMFGRRQGFILGVIVSIIGFWLGAHF